MNIRRDDMQSGEEGATILPPPPKRSAMALYMDSLGLVNVTDLDSSLVVKLMYTQADNFTGEVLYDNLTEAYLHPDAAYALIEAQKALKSYTRLIVLSFTMQPAPCRYKRRCGT